MLKCCYGIISNRKIREKIEIVEYKKKADSMSPPFFLTEILTGIFEFSALKVRPKGKEISSVDHGILSTSSNVMLNTSIRCVSD